MNIQVETDAGKDGVRFPNLRKAFEILEKVLYSIQSRRNIHELILKLLLCQ